MLYPVYSFLAQWGAPFFLKRLLKRRLQQGKEVEGRVQERFGQASRPRPAGPLVWLHGASMGEAAATLSLVDRFLDIYPNIHVLVTSGTTSSAAMLEARLPDRAFHQFLPLDVPRWAAAFLDHWRPDLALFMESEIWPNLLGALDKKRTPVCLVNGALSPRSRDLWKKFPRTARTIFSTFSCILTQGPDTEAFFREMLSNSASVHQTGNLKFAAPLLPDDPGERQLLASEILGRPFWLAASTHPGEEALIAEAHSQLKKTYPNLLTLLVPRHPERRTTIVKELETIGGLNLQCRRQGGPLLPATDLYLIDTFGELGILYRLSEIVFLGGSLVPIGGHNLVEPARLGCALLHGPHMSNQQEMTAFFKAQGATEQVQDASSLAHAVARLLKDPSLRQERAEKALKGAMAQNSVLDRVWSALAPYTSALSASKPEEPQP